MTDLIVGFVLDRSGSMQDIWSDAEGGFNSYKNSLRGDDGNTWLTLVAFDDRIEEVYTAWNVNDISDLPEIASQYDGEIFPRGTTALRDAMAQTIHSVDSWLEDNTWFNGKVLIVVNTDGYENASREYTHDQLVDLVEEKRDSDWEFVFMGANIDAFSVGMSFGVHAAAAMQYKATPDSVRQSYNSLSTATTRFRGSSSDQNFFEEDEQNA